MTRSKKLSPPAPDQPEGRPASMYVSLVTRDFVTGISEKTGYSKSQVLDFLCSLHTSEEITREMKSRGITIKRPGRQKTSIF